MSQSVGHHRILPVDEGGQPVVLPQEIARVAFLGRLEYETQPGVVAFVFHTGDPTGFASEAHSARLAETDTPSARDRPVWRASGPAPHRDGRESRAQFKRLAAACSAYSENSYCCRSAAKARCRSSISARGMARAAC